MYNTSLKPSLILSCAPLVSNYRDGSSKQETDNPHYLCHVRVVAVVTSSSGFRHPLAKGKGDSGSLPVGLRVCLRLLSLVMQSGAGGSGGFQHRVGRISGCIVRQ